MNQKKVHSVQSGELQVCIMQPRMVSVPPDGDSLERIEDRAQLAGIQKAVGGEDVLAHRIARRTVHQGEPALPVNEG